MSLSIITVQRELIMGGVPRVRGASGLNFRFRVYNARETKEIGFVLVRLVIERSPHDFFNLTSATCSKAAEFDAKQSYRRNTRQKFVQKLHRSSIFLLVKVQI